VKRVNIELDAGLHKKAKVIAILKGVTLNEYFEIAIKSSLKKDLPVLRIK
jgi:hypothetical protein